MLKLVKLIPAINKDDKSDGEKHQQTSGGSLSASNRNPRYSGNGHPAKRSGGDPAILLPPFELIAEGFLRIKITLEIVQHLSLIHPLAQTDKEKIIPVSPVIIVFLRTHRRVHDVLQSRVTGKSLYTPFTIFASSIRIGRDQLLAYRRFVTEDLLAMLSGRTTLLGSSKERSFPSSISKRNTSKTPGVTFHASSL